MVVIGSGRSSLILGLVAAVFWALAFTWYFLGVHRVNRVMGRIVHRVLHPFARPETAPPPRQRRTRRPVPPG